jgi:large subunit ribosomal protein L4
METTVYNKEGKESGKVALPESIFALPWNADLVHQVVVSEESNRRTPIAHTKDRGEVRGGGKKPWKQKGTGRARHGSSRSPIWVGGGVAHGPRNEKDYSRKVNRKMKAKALYTILAKKQRDGEIIFIDSLSFDTPKTKIGKGFIDAIGKVKGFERIITKKINKAYIAASNDEKEVKRVFNNFGSIEVGDVRNLHPVDILKYKYLVISKPEEAFKVLGAKLETKTGVKKAKTKAIAK